VSNLRKEGDAMARKRVGKKAKLKMVRGAVHSMGKKHGGKKKHSRKRSRK
jgi:hypothetical protein